MRKIVTSACVTFTIGFASAPAFSNDLVILSPASVQAFLDPATPMTVDAIDITSLTQLSVTAGSQQQIDMSGADGSLRSCYENGGIAKQGQDLSYFCAANEAARVQSSSYIAPPTTNTGYNGTNNIQDTALVDCVERGGSLIQLATMANTPAPCSTIDQTQCCREDPVNSFPGLCTSNADIIGTKLRHAYFLNLGWSLCVTTDAQT